jgi:hypothetical protein
MRHRPSGQRQKQRHSSPRSSLTLRGIPEPTCRRSCAPGRRRCNRCGIFEHQQDDIARCQLQSHWQTATRFRELCGAREGEHSPTATAHSRAAAGFGSLDQQTDAFAQSSIGKLTASPARFFHFQATDGRIGDRLGDARFSVMITIYSNPQFG